jgi:hypothetical protein
MKWCTVDLVTSVRLASYSPIYSTKNEFSRCQWLRLYHYGNEWKNYEEKLTTLINKFVLNISGANDTAEIAMPIRWKISAVPRTPLKSFHRCQWHRGNSFDREEISHSLYDPNLSVFSETRCVNKHWRVKKLFPGPSY